MRIRTCTVILLLLLVTPVQPVSANEEDSTLEAREAQAEFLPDIETTRLTWRNIATTDGLLLDQLKMATYEIHRSDNGRFYQNSMTTETMIAEKIPACYMNDLNEDCSGKVHSILYEPSPGAQRNVYYAIVTVLRDGTRTESANIGLSQTMPGHIEVVAPSVAPEQFNASYDVANMSTVFTWRPACPGNNFYHTLYEHNEPATRATWGEIDKTIVTNYIPASASKYSIDWTNQSVEREIYYTLTCYYPAYDDGQYSSPAMEDTRLHSGNTLATPLVEDNQAPRYGGSLSAQFNLDATQTILQWSETTQPEADKIRVYHASNPIVSLEQNGVQLLAELDSTSVEFIHHLPADWMLTSYYAIGLVDGAGNAQTNQFDVSGKVGPIVERNLPISITSLQAEQENATIHFQWDLNPQFISGDAVLWTSTSPNPDMSPAWEEVTRLNPQNLEHHMVANTSTSAWYALTLEGTWGSSPSVHHDNRIYIGKNAVLLTPPIEQIDSDSSNQEEFRNLTNVSDFAIHLSNANVTLENGDWITLESQTNQTFTLKFTHSQSNSTIRWTDALNSNPFWSAAVKSGNEFSISISEPINLIHIESTDVNGDIDIVRVGIDWPDDVIEESDTNESEGVILDELAAVEEGSISMPLLIVIGIIAAYITVILLMKKGDALSYSSEEE